MPERTYSHPRWARLRSVRPLGLRSERALMLRTVRGELVSLAGLIGRPVLNPADDEVGHLVDVVVRFAAEGEAESYPPATGLIIRVGRRRLWVSAGKIAAVSHGEVRLSTARLDLTDYARRRGEVRLAAELMDHQLIDVDGRRVIRAADLVLAPLRDELRLVGVDVSMTSLMRRIGPSRLRVRPTPDRVIDWAAIQPLADQAGNGGVRLRANSGEALQALRPSELADLLEELGRAERHRLLDTLDNETAADAVEEMEPEEVQSLLRDATPQTAAEILAEMEPDEAIDALRDMDEDDRGAVLRAMAPDVAERLMRLLSYDENRAGGVMTTTVVQCRETESVAEVIERLRGLEGHAVDLDAIIVVDPDGRLLDDVTVLELLLASPPTPLGRLIGPPWPVTVGTETPVDEVAIALIENRSASIVVVDDDGRPLGRILADDVVDALVAEKNRFQIFRQGPA